MALELARQMAEECRKLAEYLHQTAEALENGMSCHSTAGKDDTSAQAAGLRHRARNIEAVLVAFERLEASEELKAAAALSAATHSVGEGPRNS